MAKPSEDPPFEGGAQPVKERAPEVPGGGRSVLQMVVIVIGVLALLAALVWIVVPLAGGS